MRILSFTGSRAEYYILRPLFIKLSIQKNIDFKLIVSGGITNEANNKTLNDIKKDKIDVVEIIDIPADYINHSQIIGYLCIQLHPIISKIKPDLCIVYADRYESFAFTIAATHSNIIILHIEAGDITQGGTYDDYIRHCITKMSHLFCTSTKRGKSVVRALGEENWRIIQSGLLSYDDMALIKNSDKDALIKELNIDDSFPIILATMHPLTLDKEKTKRESVAFFRALYKISVEEKVHIIITAPNSDNGNDIIMEEINNLVRQRKEILFFESLGGFRYQTLMSLAENRPVIVCGNSSSIIKEAPFFNAFSLNVGIRQQGREAASTQINCIAKEDIIY
ncbi:UDP-N-acetylglucosamine 2-epimerase, partial [Prochlorococcus sp. AH-716-E13]|nr:UDP-N-acetylglucosamine 2-epimerase [Prochlorococcus sp. AH-716-E13]